MYLMVQQAGGFPAANIRSPRLVEKRCFHEEVCCFCDDFELGYVLCDGLRRDEERDQEGHQGNHAGQHHRDCPGDNGRCPREVTSLWRFWALLKRTSWGRVARAGPPSPSRFLGVLIEGVGQVGNLPHDITVGPSWYLGYGSHSRGLHQANLGKRRKSASVEHNRQPCSTVRAARWASETRFATALAE
jgi:hypothetical protein